MKKTSCARLNSPKTELVRIHMHLPKRLWAISGGLETRLDYMDQPWLYRKPGTDHKKVNFYHTRILARCVHFDDLTHSKSKQVLACLEGTGRRRVFSYAWAAAIRTYDETPSDILNNYIGRRLHFNPTKGHRFHHYADEPHKPITYADLVYFSDGEWFTLEPYNPKAQRPWWTQ